MGLVLDCLHVLAVEEVVLVLHHVLDVEGIVRLHGAFVRSCESATTLSARSGVALALSHVN